MKTPNRKTAPSPFGNIGHISYTSKILNYSVDSILIDSALANYANGINDISFNAENQPLHIAATKGDVRAGILVLENNPDTNIKDKLGLTALHLAAHFGYCDFIKLLIAQGADLNAQNSLGDTPLHSAICRYKKISTLDKAETERILSVITLLLNSGADLSIKNHAEETPVSKGKHFLELQNVFLEHYQSLSTVKSLKQICAQHVRDCYQDNISAKLPEELFAYVCGFTPSFLDRQQQNTLNTSNFKLYHSELIHEIRKTK